MDTLEDVPMAHAFMLGRCKISGVNWSQPNHFPIWSSWVSNSINTYRNKMATYWGWCSLDGLVWLHGYLLSKLGMSVGTWVVLRLTQVQLDRTEMMSLKMSLHGNLIWWFPNWFSVIDWLFKGVLHLLPKISMFCALSQNNQQLFEK